MSKAKRYVNTTNTTRKNKPFIIVLILFLLLAVIIGGYFAVEHFKPDWIFRIKQRFVQASSSIELKELSSDRFVLVDRGLDELINSGATYNQSLMLINNEFLLPNDFKPDTAEYKDTGVIMNSSITDAYAELSADISEIYDNKLFVMSSFRTAEEQAAIIEEEGDTAASVGASEHQAGLALDVYVKYYAGMGFLESKEGQYVNLNAWKYGFIIRYPDYGTDSTGIEYEPWHIRYVGAPHAEVMMKNKLTLEEYIDGLKPGCFYSVGDYIITRQSESFSLPSDYSNLVISPDNTGSYILTFKQG